MRAQQAGSTRDRILDVALDLFSRKGYEGTSIRDIAEEMSMTKAAVYYHFPSKEELLADVLNPAMARVGRVLEEHEPVRDPAGRRAFVTALVEVIAEVGPRVVMMLNDPAVGSHIRALTGGSGLPQRVAGALLGTGATDPGAAATERIRAACAVATLPAGIAAWRQDNPRQAHLDDATKSVLVEVVLAVVGRR